MFNADPEPEPEIKRLCFTLYKHGLKDFLFTESFQGILLKYDKFDVIWSNFEKRVRNESAVNILVPGFTGHAEDTMKRFLNVIYISQDERLLPFLDDLLIELSKEKDLIPIIDEIKSHLKQMKFNDKSIKQMEFFKQNMHRESKTLKPNFAKENLTESKLFPNQQFEIDDRLCFILMPFDEKYNSVYDNIIKKASADIGLEAKRADDIFDTNPIIHDIWEHINKAKLIIANLSGKNPNVFYEVGLCHALHKKVILITDSMNDVPFDLRHLRCITYDHSISGAEKLRYNLTQTMKRILNE